MTMKIAVVSINATAIFILSWKEIKMEKWIYEKEYKTLSNEECLLDETVFHNANGYLGVRACFEEGYPEGYQTIRGTYINGVYDIADMKQAEPLYGLPNKKQTILNVADTQGIKLYLGKEEYSAGTGTLHSCKRSLDMADGVTKREVDWTSPQGKQIRLEIKRMASFVEKNLFMIEYKLTSVNYKGEVRIESSHSGDVKNFFDASDPRVSAEAADYLEPVQCRAENGIAYIVQKTKTTGQEICSAVKNVSEELVSLGIFREERKAKEILEGNIEPGETITLYKYTVLTDSRRFENCLDGGKKVMEKILRIGADNLYHMQASYLNDFWQKSHLEIMGNDKMNLAIRYNLYQLLQSTGKDEYSSVAAKGLSGEGYEGHYFWDAEIYILPFFLLTNPKIARSLLEYRYSILDGARKHAAIMGHRKGALYPWRTISGEECSGYFLSGSAQYHINSDITYALISYYLATKDEDFMLDKGFEMLVETSRLWLDAGGYVDGRFHITAVTGPDEYTCMVNDNYYTNVSVQYSLRWTARLYRKLKDSDRLAVVCEKLGVTEKEIEEFDKAADAMFFPSDDKTNVIPQDGGFFTKPVLDLKKVPEDHFPLLLHYHPLFLNRYQVCKQADVVLASFLYEDSQTEEVMRASFDYYEKITTHDSSLSRCIFGIVAAKLGELDKAVEYMGDSAFLDLFNTHHNTKDGIHTANMGGVYMGIVYGMGGVRLKENGLYISPVLPKEWEGYEFTITYEGRQIQITVTDHVRIKTETDKPLNLFVYGEPYEVCGQLELKRR